MKLEHIGIAVADLDSSEHLFEDLLETKVYKREEVPSQSVITSFLKSGEVKIELLHSTDPSGPIGRYLQQHGEGIHHLAFEVKDIKAQIQRLQESGYILIHPTPVKGADNKWVVFLHPRSTNKVLIELCQEIKDHDGF